MSKKIAAGASSILIDVKCGRGAFMKTVPQARKLSKVMVEIGSRMGRRVTCLITPMDEPLGRAVGNALEVREAIETLKGEGPEDFTEAILELCGELLFLSDKTKSSQEGRKISQEALASGVALKKFDQMLKAQGGDERVIKEPWRLPQGQLRWIVPSKKGGFIKRIDALKIGKAAMVLGGGRERKEDRIDYGVGVQLRKKTGDKVVPEEPLAVLYVNDRQKLREAQKLVEKSFTFSDEPVQQVFKPLGRISNV